MQKDIFRPFLNENSDKLNFLRYNTIGKNKDKYFDFTASGLAFRQIENRIHEVLETYANTHSKESSNAKITTKYYEDARQTLQKSLEIDDSFAILPCGSGATGAIKKLQEILGVYIPPKTKERLKEKGLKIDKKSMPLVIVGPYEHHSNEVSFRESLAQVKRVKLRKDGLIDLEEEVSLSEVFAVFPWDAAVALNSILNKRYGWSPAERTPSMFGSRPPEIIAVETSIDTVVHVPWGRFSLPAIKGWIDCGVTRKDGRISFRLNARILRKDEAQIKSLFEELRTELQARSIYRGKAFKMRFRDEDGDSR
jgi:hypothetical protein